MKHKKPFKDGEMERAASLEAVNLLFRDFKNKSEIMAAVKDIQLSRNTVSQRCEGITGNLEKQLEKDIDCCECFSLQFDEFTDITMWHSCVFSSEWCLRT